LKGLLEGWSQRLAAEEEVAMLAAVVHCSTLAGTTPSFLAAFAILAILAIPETTTATTDS